MDNIKISIIIPVFNVESYLERCLNSVVNQTLREIEILCYDDASTDNSLNILRKFEVNDPRVKVFSLQKCGQGAIRNRGIQEAKGEFIGFVDADDSVDLSMFSTLYHAATKNNSEIAFCHPLCLNSKAEVVKYPYFDRERKKLKSKLPEETFDSGQIIPYLSSITVVCWNKIYKSSFLKTHNITFGKGIIHEDIPFYYQSMLSANNITVVKKALYNYSANRIGSTTNVVMSTNPRLIQMLNHTRGLISAKLENKEIAAQFFIFKVDQILSFLNYTFHRHQLSKFTKFRFFNVVRQEFLEIDKLYLCKLNFDQKLQVIFIKKRWLKLYRLRTLYEAAKYHTQDWEHFKQLPLDLMKLVFYHTRWWVYKFLEILKLRKAS